MLKTSEDEYSVADTCPVDYIYRGNDLLEASNGNADILYIVGNLYGNTEALKYIIHRAQKERGNVRIVFNGDFHWLDILDSEFEIIARGVSNYDAITGNAEREMTRKDRGFGCGCGYPDTVDEGVIRRSNEIAEMMRATASRFPSHCRWLAELPMCFGICVGGERILIVHGDTRSLSGWRFERDSVNEISDDLLSSEFRRVNAKIIACSHTGFPYMRRFHSEKGKGILVNNGAAGLPNFRGSHYGIATRITAIKSEIPTDSLYGVELGDIRCDAIPLNYDINAWIKRFLTQWKHGSPGHTNYFDRICGHGLVDPQIRIC